MSIAPTKFMQDMLFVSPDETEWDYMWRELRKVTGSTADENEHSGEFWQYMGTTWTETDARRSVSAVHQFRHRDRIGKPLEITPNVCGLRNRRQAGTEGTRCTVGIRSTMAWQLG